ncbi:unnamed protein product [Calicophoron daubneyi]|uniref:RNA helicase n=1 Tax=Calicophoron daubneyi TaxID=300641 RepID=A0AAV2TY02_CALDB
MTRRRRARTGNSLPISQYRDLLIQAVKENQVLIVIGETGCGKSTQIPQYLDQAGYTELGQIGCTQPRRVAAKALATRVAEEFGCRIKEEVGYAIRFEKRTSAATKIKYMTDGILVRECLADRALHKYSVIILDEAHERTLNMDLLFALMKKTLRKRRDLRLIISSATLDAEKFSRFFGNAPILFIEGRTYPVETVYSEETPNEYERAVMEKVVQIHLNEPPGDILAFLTGQEEIERCCEAIEADVREQERVWHQQTLKLMPLPAYAELNLDDLCAIFEPTPPGSRKVIFATNVAESSLTVEGIRYVVDSGFFKQKTYNPRLRTDSLNVTVTSQNQAKQRAGRAGRTAPGFCYRLYTKEYFENEMPLDVKPEIQRASLAGALLQLKAKGIKDINSLKFMDPPSKESIRFGEELLRDLSALNANGELTGTGKMMALFPLEPGLSRMLIESIALGCSREMAKIVAMLSAGIIFAKTRKSQRRLAGQARAKFREKGSDDLTWLNVFDEWDANRHSKSWCRTNFLQIAGLQEANAIFGQLLRIMDRHGLPVISCGSDRTRIQRAIFTAFSRNLACMLTEKDVYIRLFDGSPLKLHASSRICAQDSNWVVCREIDDKSGCMRHVTVIDTSWIRKSYSKFASA